MKYVHFLRRDRAWEGYGVLDGETVHVLDGSYFGTHHQTGEMVDLSQVFLLAPCRFTKAVCVGLNYRDHAMEFKLPIPEKPMLFMKPSTSLLDPFADIHYPTGMTSHLDYEGELAVVIGRKAKNVDAKDWKEYVLGYTIANDVTARDLQPKTGQWTVAKGFDTFCPLGPVIETDLDPANLDLCTRVNGEVKQYSNTKNLIFDVPYLVSYISHVMTLLPGDIISTGTPSGISKLDHGDEVAITIENIGTLSNRVD